MDSIIEVKNLGKKYQIGEKQSYLALRDTLTNLAKSPLHWLKGKTRGESETVGKNDFWALQDLNFEVQKGEVIGIIGKNGAGKSTLLKILSQITPPTTGEIKLRGRIGSLLEVGTGFHPELTGRENIFLNGSILGMNKKEIESKFDEIVEFSGIEKFLDTPVKRYSSGMYVRLAFSVAAHMDPEILIVDEVLAVGDAEFQKKCLGKMKDITSEKERTILFVSHNMAAIKHLCTRVIWLENSKVKMNGQTEKIVSQYLKSTTSEHKQRLESKKDRTGDGSVIIENIEITNTNNYPTISCGDSIKLKITLSEQLNKLKNIELKIPFIDGNDIVIFRIDTGHINTDKMLGNTITITTEPLLVTPSYFTLNTGLFINNNLTDYVQNAIDFDMEPSVKSKRYTRDQTLMILDFSILL